MVDNQKGIRLFQDGRGIVHRNHTLHGLGITSIHIPVKHIDPLPHFVEIRYQGVCQPPGLAASRATRHQ